MTKLVLRWMALAVGDVLINVGLRLVEFGMDFDPDSWEAVSGSFKPPVVRRNLNVN